MTTISVPKTPFWISIFRMCCDLWCVFHKKVIIIIDSPRSYYVLFIIILGKLLLHRRAVKTQPGNAINSQSQPNINSQTSTAKVSNCNLFISIYCNIILKMEKQIIVEFLNLFIISWIHLWKERICYNEQLLINISTKYNFSVEIMNALDISNYLTPRYLAELIDNNEYYINLRNYGERYD